MENLLQLLLLGSFFTIQNPQFSQMGNVIPVEQKAISQKVNISDNEDFSKEHELYEKYWEKYEKTFYKGIDDLLGEERYYELKDGNLSFSLGKDGFDIYYGDIFITRFGYSHVLRPIYEYFGGDHAFVTAEEFENEYFKDFDVKNIIKGYVRISREDNFLKICRSGHEYWECHIVDELTEKYLWHFPHPRNVKRQGEVFVVSYGWFYDLSGIAVIGKNFRFDSDSGYKPGYRNISISQDDKQVEVKYTNEKSINKVEKILWKDIVSAWNGIGLE